VQSQIGETRSRGIEASAEVDFTAGLSSIASYTYNEVEVVEAGGSQASNGKRGVDRPDHLAKLWLDYDFQQPTLAGLGIGAGVRYNISSFSNADNTSRYPSATLVDAAVRYTFDNVRLQVSANNLFDEVKIYCSGSQPSSSCDYGLARNVLGRITYRWDGPGCVARSAKAAACRPAGTLWVAVLEAVSPLRLHAGHSRTRRASRGPNGLARHAAMDRLWLRAVLVDALRRRTTSNREIQVLSNRRPFQIDDREHDRVAIDAISADLIVAQHAVLLGAEPFDGRS